MAFCVFATKTSHPGKVRVEYAATRLLSREETMRLTLLAGVLCAGLFAFHARAQDVTAEEKAFFDKNAGQLVTLEPTPIPGDALDKVFAAKFYSVKVSSG